MCVHIAAQLKAKGHFAHLVRSMDRSREGIVDFQHESDIRNAGGYFSCRTSRILTQVGAVFTHMVLWLGRLTVPKETSRI